MNRTVETVWAVTVENRVDGLYLFRQMHDAERFALAVESAGGKAAVTEEPINHSPATVELIEQEAAR